MFKKKDPKDKKAKGKKDDSSDTEGAILCPRFAVTYFEREISHKLTLFISQERPCH